METARGSSQRCELCGKDEAPDGFVRGSWRSNGHEDLALTFHHTQALYTRHGQLLYIYPETVLPTSRCIRCCEML